MEAVLSVQSINKHYPGFALENVSFSLAPNRIMGLIGKNGAGKSTTLKIIEIIIILIAKYEILAGSVGKIDATPS